MKKLLLSLLCAVSAIAPALAETKTYQLCTSLDEITNPANQFIIATSKVLGSNTLYAVGKDVSTNCVKASTGVSSVPETLSVDANALGLAVISIVPNGDNYAIYDNSSEVYWGLPASKTFKTSDTLDGSDNMYKVSVGFDSGTSSVLLTSVTSTTTSCALFNYNSGNPYFRVYKSTNKTSAQYALPYFYKEVTESSEPEDPEFSGFDELYTIEKGESMDVPAIKPANLKYTFDSADENIVAIEDGKMVGKAMGTTTVNFTTEAVEGKYNEGHGSFQVHVTGLIPEMSFRDPILVAKLGVGVVWEQVDVTEPEDPELRGDITYSSSNESIAVVDPQTGQIKPGDLKEVGTVTITATMSAKGEWDEGSASYKLVVYDPTAEVQPATSEFDFTVKNPYGMTTKTGSETGDNMYETNVTEINDGVVTISFGGKYRSWTMSNGNGYELRLQQTSKTNTTPGSMTISVPEGYKLTKVELVATDDKADKVGGTYDPAGKNQTQSNQGADVANSTWEPTGTDPVESVTYTTGNANTQIWQIYVMYEAATSDLKSADLSFDKVIYPIYMDEESEVNAVKNPFDREVTYSIPSLDPSEYTITDKGDGNLLVTVTKPGAYTLQAKSAAGKDEATGDLYRDGLAILRLNVYRHLEVYVGEDKLTANAEGVEEITTTSAQEVTMVVPDNAMLYYQIVKNEPATAADETTDDENQRPGYTYSDDGVIEIPAKTNGKLNFYIANYGYLSPVRTIMLNDPTSVGISEVEVSGVKAAYDLQGRKVANPKNGLFIVGGKLTRK